MRDPGPRRTLLLVVMCVGYFLVLLDVTIVNVALPSIGVGLQASVGGLQWVVDAYAVALAALLLAGGSLGDVLGHRPVVLTGLAVFGVASLGCGLAPTLGVLAAARVAQGVGAALLLPGTLAIISRAFPDRAERARAIGVWAAVGSIALPVGPLLGGALVGGPGWRWVFLGNAPVVLVAGVFAVRLLPPDRGSRGRIDVLGTVLGALALAALTYAVIASSLLVLVAAGAAGVAFVLVEHRSAHPALPLELFGRRGFGVANAVAGAMNLGTLGLLFVVTLFLQGVQGRDPLAAGLALLPAFLPLALLAAPAGRVVARIGPRPVLVTGLVVAAVGVALFARVDVGSAYGRLLPALFLWGLGLALLTPAVVAAAVAAVPRERAGLASGVNNTARQAGGAIGVAAYGAIAGAPSQPVTFVHGLHVTALVSAGLFVVAAVAGALRVPDA